MVSNFFFFFFPEKKVAVLFYLFIFFSLDFSSFLPQATLKRFGGRDGMLGVTIQGPALLGDSTQNLANMLRRRGEGKLHFLISPFDYFVAVYKDCN